MREVFLRTEDLQTTKIEVDVDAIGYKNRFAWLFSIFVKHETSQTNRYEEFLEIKETLIISLTHNDKAKYVGSRKIGEWSEIYFYTSTSKELNQIVATVLKGTNFIYESNVVKDIQWNFYQHELFPTELEYHHITSDKIIEQLKDEGDMLDTPRDVEHYISFDTPTQKQRFLDNLNIDGFKYKDDIDTDEFEHGIALVCFQPITNDIMKNNIQKIYPHIKKENGYYEGWSTLLVEDEEI